MPGCAASARPGPPVQVHPHKHGSTTLQSITASLLIIVDDDPRWLPDAIGCAEVREALR
jgi:alpha-D-ribose 1-methylphosphonate 5-triphosphate synthase subunit PhnH